MLPMHLFIHHKSLLLAHILYSFQFSESLISPCTHPAWFLITSYPSVYSLDFHHTHVYQYATKCNDFVWFFLIKRSCGYYHKVRVLPIVYTCHNTFITVRDFILSATKKVTCDKIVLPWENCYNFFLYKIETKFKQI